MKVLVADATDHIQQLTLSLHDFRQYRVGDDEIRIAGKMYDIKNTAIKKDTVVLSVLSDEEENSILAGIMELIDDDDMEDDDLSKSLIDLLTAAYIPPSQYTVCFCFLSSQEMHSRYVQNEDLYNHMIFSPPPKLV